MNRMNGEAVRVVALRLRLGDQPLDPGPDRGRAAQMHRGPLR